MALIWKTTALVWDNQSDQISQMDLIQFRLIGTWNHMCISQRVPELIQFDLEMNQMNPAICQIDSIFCEFVQSRANRSELNKSRQSLDGHQRVRYFCISPSRSYPALVFLHYKNPLGNPDLVIEKQLHLNGGFSPISYRIPWSYCGAPVFPLKTPM